MQLTMASYQVDRVEMGESTYWKDRVLYINDDELRKLLLAEFSNVFKDISLEFVYPGEKARIIHVLDAVEPRVKASGHSSCFPGFLGPARTVGEGITNRLAGVAVLGSGELPQPTSGVLEFNEGFIDMSGPAQKFCTCGDTINICLCFKVNQGCTNEDFDAAARLATLKTADYLAKSTIGLKPTDEVIYHTRQVNNDLPRVAYINQVQSQGFLCRTFLYGSPMEGYFTPTLLHPNEILDGAVVSGNYRSVMKSCTYLKQNNPVVLELLKRHGKEVDFVGQIVGRGHFNDLFMKERQGQYAAKLAKLLHAQIAILTLEGTGNSNIDYMQTVRALEQSGICAVPIIHEFGGIDGKEWPLVDAVPEAVSIVTGGGVNRLITVPAMERVVGGESMYFTTGPLSFQTVDAASSFTCSHENFYCGYWQTQVCGQTAVEY